MVNYRTFSQDRSIRSMPAKNFQRKEEEGDLVAAKMACFADDTAIIERRSVLGRGKAMTTEIMADWKEKVHP